MKIFKYSRHFQLSLQLAPRVEEEKKKLLLRRFERLRHHQQRREQQQQEQDGKPCNSVGPIGRNPAQL